MSAVWPSRNRGSLGANMKAGDTAITIESSAFARLSSGVARLIPASLQNYRLLGLLVVCLLAVSTDKVWAQLCRCAEPGWMNCSIAGFHSHEPATAAFPQCMRRAPRTTPQPGSARGTPPAAGAAKGFQPGLQDQIKPLNCPLHVAGLIRVAPTFYGGTRCAVLTPSPAAGIQLPWEPPPVPTPQSQVSPPAQAGPPSTQLQPSQTAASPPPQPTAADQTANGPSDLQRTVDDNWGAMRDYFNKGKAAGTVGTDPGGGPFGLFPPSEYFPWGHAPVWPR
jgi:hypothetical protein